LDKYEKILIALGGYEDFLKGLSQKEIEQLNISDFTEIRVQILAYLSKVDETEVIPFLMSNSIGSNSLLIAHVQYQCPTCKANTSLHVVTISKGETFIVDINLNDNDELKINCSCRENGKILVPKDELYKNSYLVYKLRHKVEVPFRLKHANS